MAQSQSLCLADAGGLRTLRVPRHLVDAVAFAGALPGSIFPGVTLYRIDMGATSSRTSWMGRWGAGEEQLELLANTTVR